MAPEYYSTQMFLGATTGILPLGTNIHAQSLLMWYGMHVGWLALAPWPLVSCHITCLVGQLMTCVWNCRLTPIIVFPLVWHAADFQVLATSGFNSVNNFWFQPNQRPEFKSILLQFDWMVLTLATRCCWSMRFGNGDWE